MASLALAVLAGPLRHVQLPRRANNFRGSAWTFVHGIDDQVYVNRFQGGIPSGYQVLPGLKITGSPKVISTIREGDDQRVFRVFAR